MTQRLRIDIKYFIYNLMLSFVIFCYLLLSFFIFCYRLKIIDLKDKD